MPSLSVTVWAPVRRALTVTAAAALLLGGALAEVATAHGSSIDPPSRNYGCYERWANDFQNPRMATDDPMCWQAWQADSTAMWNWNSLYIDGVDGQHQAHIPDGQLCSAGNTGGTRYASLDVPGNWRAASVGTNFTVTYHDQALHGADYHLVYVTRQGFDPLTQRLRWSDLELVRTTSGAAPGAGTRTSNPNLNGVSVDIPVSAPGRTGRHIVYLIWKASHADQTYYFCSDVNFGGTGATPAPTTPAPAPTTPAPVPTTAVPTTAVPTTAVPTTSAPGDCTATFAVVASWQGGFQAEVRVTAGASELTGWTVGWTNPTGQQVTQAWNAALTSSGSSVTARNAAYNGALAAGASTSFGLIGSATATPSASALTCRAG
ncbi:lytic polysaccharide monooxygenase [Solwaraspora sp. WMMA2056]|uniref:lytic polysaccharide monooxygenase auxiliary activity family 9 protein n=1 Tax=Solwaraspora sp. WMMA2056 TaxID=3015161 RepID=UPI00259BDFBA|nr:lytic polysaccharide monooxygenase [Solwaraspora sp. WMMA2056]WJK39019.1 lytic polysaccharide monooxygenase [Solwaraspora sp. WMMA2056]